MKKQIMYLLFFVIWYNVYKVEGCDLVLWWWFIV